MSNVQMDASRPPVVMIPVSRTKALTRAVLWGVCVVGMVYLALTIYSQLNFRSSAVSSRLVDISVAIVASPLWLGALYFLYKSARWLVLCLWPGPVGVFADDQWLVLRLGSFGFWRFDAPRIDSRYPFEVEDDLEDGDYESFLSEEDQRATLVPRLMHPESPEPIDRTIERYVDIADAELAQVLRPVVDLWRGEAPRSPDESDAGDSH